MLDAIHWRSGSGTRFVIRVAEMTVHHKGIVTNLVPCWALRYALRLVVIWFVAIGTRMTRAVYPNRAVTAGHTKAPINRLVLCASIRNIIASFTFIAFYCSLPIEGYTLTAVAIVVIRVFVFTGAHTKKTAITATIVTGKVLGRASDQIALGVATALVSVRV